jgi:uncharacterized protein (TIGR02452 family)
MAFTVLSPFDSVEQGAMAMLALTHDRSSARQLGRSAVEISTLGFYEVDGNTVSIHGPLYKALQSKISIPPDADLPEHPNPTTFPQTFVQVRNVSSMDAAKELIAQGHHPMILNFANPITPGGGFLNGALAQEETLCRSSGLYATLLDDPMYPYHKGRFDSRMASDWAILSPNVPFFRTDDGTFEASLWLGSVLTCAAPQADYAEEGQVDALMRRRIPRILDIMATHGYTDIILGAWGCGAFGCDPKSIGKIFVDTIRDQFAGKFRTVIFAIVDDSMNRRLLKPFVDAVGRISTAHVST